MSKLRLASIEDDKPVRITLELPASVHRDLATYANLISESSSAIEPARLIAPMLARFMAADRVFARAKRSDGPRKRSRPSKQTAGIVESPSHQPDHSGSV